MQLNTVPLSEAESLPTRHEGLGPHQQLLMDNIGVSPTNPVLATSPSRQCPDRSPTGNQIFLFFFYVIYIYIMFPLLCGVDVRLDTPPCSMVVQCSSRQFLLFDTILYFVKPSSLRSFPQFLCPSYSFISLPRIPVPALPTSFMPSR